VARETTNGIIIGRADRHGHYHASFTYTVDPVDSTIRLSDIGHTYTKSLTNDAPNVVAQLYRRLGDLDSYEIIYEDSQGCWDGIRVISNAFAGFYPLYTDRSPRAIYDDQ